MAILNVKGGSLIATIPPLIAEYLEVKKGDEVGYKINKKTGQVELVKIEGGKK